MAVSPSRGTTAPRGLPQPELIRWPLVAARDLFELKYGKALVKADRKPGNVPVYGTNGRCGSHHQALFKGPGVILGRKGQGPLGVEWSESDYWVIDTAYALAPLRSDIDLRYAYFLIKFIGLNHLKDGTSNPTLSRDTFGAQALPLPPLPQQRAIAHILGTLDDKIELNRRMSETLETMAQRLFQSWFVDFDPVRAKAEARETALEGGIAEPFPGRLQNAEIGEIPAGWAVGRFADVVEVIREQDNPLESPEQVFSHHSIPAFDEGRTPKREHGGSIRSLKFRVPEGAVLLSKLNPEIDRVWLVDVQPDEHAVCSTEFLVLRSRPPFTRAFVYCLTRSLPFRQQLEGLVTGTSKSHQRAQADSVLNLGTILPPSAVVGLFDRLATPALARVLRCRAEIAVLATLRDTLLPKLISGDLRVKDAERFAAQIA